MKLIKSFVPHSRCFGSYFDVIFLMYLVSSGFSFKPTSSCSSSSSSTQFSQEWARRKVVVKHSIKSNQNWPPCIYLRRKYCFHNHKRDWRCAIVFEGVYIGINGTRPGWNRKWRGLIWTDVVHTGMRRDPVAVVASWMRDKRHTSAIWSSLTVCVLGRLAEIAHRWHFE